MGEFIIKVWCSECGTSKVLCEYDEKSNDIKCSCTDCDHEGSLKNFEYLIDTAAD